MHSKVYSFPLQRLDIVSILFVTTSPTATFKNRRSQNTGLNMLGGSLQNPGYQQLPDLDVATVECSLGGGDDVVVSVINDAVILDEVIQLKIFY